jgi:hypothetical protein
MGSLALAGLVLGALITGGIIGAAVMSVVHYEQARREMDAEQESVPDRRYEGWVMPPPPRKPGKRNPVDEWV